jgi:hypothetical protein
MYPSNLWTFFVEFGTWEFWYRYVNITCLFHVATINVDSPDLTREFIWTLTEITHNKYNTLSRLIAHKRESCSNALVDSVLVIPGRSLVPCVPECWSSADFTGRLLNHNQFCYSLTNYFTSLYFTHDSSSGTKLLKTETELFGVL